MKIEHIINETTTAGAVSSVAMPLGQTQRRTTENVKGLIPAEKVLKAKKKGPYANSLSEGKEKKPVIEADLQEDDLIIIPGQSKRLKAGFIPKAQDRTDHEVEMAKADLLALYKNTKSVLMCIKDISEDEGLEGWVQEKIIKASDYMNTLAEYFEGKKIQEMTGGVIAAGGVGEGVAEGTEQVFKVVAVTKSNALEKPTTLNVKASSLDEVFERLAINDWYPLEINGIEVVNGKRLKQGVAEGYKEPTDAAGHAKMAAKIKRMLDDTLADRGDRHGNPDPQQLTRAYEYHMQKAKEKSQGVAEGMLDRFKKKTQQPEDPSYKKGWELCNKDPSADPQFLFRKFGGGLDRNQFMKGFNDNAKSRGMKLRGDVGSNELTHGDIKYKEFKRDRGVAEGLDTDTQRLEQEVRDALAKGDDYTAKKLVKMAQTAADRNYLRKIIRQEMYGTEPGQGGVAEGTLTEKAKSTAQQKFFGMAHAMQKGKKIPGASKELKDVAKSMSKSDVTDFAKTKHKDLPSHVKKEK